MTGMELYSKFMLTLAIGLAGVGVVLMTLLETLFRDWNPAVDVRRWWRGMSHHRPASVRAEDILSELEGRRSGRYVYATRPPVKAADRPAADRPAASPDLVEAL